MILGKRVLGIIPARYGTKRLKLKNISNVGGKPLLAWTILSAKKSKYLDSVILSTESKKIAKIAAKYGCEVPFLRKKILSNDNISSEEVVSYTLKKLNKIFHYVMLLQPTSPLRKARDIDKALRKIVNTNAVSLMSVYRSRKINKFPVVVKNNRIINKNKNLLNKKKRYNYYLNGAIYLAKFSYIIKNKSFFSKNTIIFDMPEKRSIDIDTLEDLKKLKKIL